MSLMTNLSLAARRVHGERPSARPACPLRWTGMPALNARGQHQTAAQLLPSSRSRRPLALRCALSPVTSPRTQGSDRSPRITSRRVLRHRGDRDGAPGRRAGIRLLVPVGSGSGVFLRFFSARLGGGGAGGSGEQLERRPGFPERRISLERDHVPASGGADGVPEQADRR